MSLLTRFLRRRTQYVSSFVGMLIVFSCITACSAVYANNPSDQSAAIGVVALIFLYYTCYLGMQPLHYIYMTEVFPFASRSKGLALTQFFARGGGAFNLFVNPIGLQSLQWKYYLVFVCWLCVEIAVIYFVYPETKAASLEEAAILMEGDNARVGLVMLGKEGQLAPHTRHLEEEAGKEGKA